MHRSLAAYVLGPSKAAVCLLWLPRRPRAKAPASVACRSITRKGFVAAPGRCAGCLYAQPAVQALKRPSLATLGLGKRGGVPCQPQVRSLSWCMTRHAGWIERAWAAAHSTRTAKSGGVVPAARLPPASAGDASAAGSAVPAKLSMLQGWLPQPFVGPAVGKLSPAWPRQERAGTVIPSDCRHRGSLPWRQPLWPRLPGTLLRAWLRRAGGQVQHQTSLPQASRSFSWGAAAAHSAQPGRTPAVCGSSRRLLGSVAGRPQGAPAAPQAQPTQSSRAAVQGRSRSAPHELPRLGRRGNSSQIGVREAARWAKLTFWTVFLTKFLACLTAVSYACQDWQVLHSGLASSKSGPVVNNWAGAAGGNSGGG